MGGAGRTRDGAIHRQGPRTARESRHSAQTSTPTTMRTYSTVRRIECCTRDGHAGGTPLPARTCGAREQRVPPRSQREPASTPGGLIRGAPRGPPGPFRRSGPLPHASRPHWPAGACMQIGRLPASMARSGPPSPKGSCAAALHQRYALTDDSTGVPIPVGIRGGDIRRGDLPAQRPTHQACTDCHRTPLRRAKITAATASCNVGSRGAPPRPTVAAGARAWGQPRRQRPGA